MHFLNKDFQFYINSDAVIYVRLNNGEKNIMVSILGLSIIKLYRKNIAQVILEVRLSANLVILPFQR